MNTDGRGATTLSLPIPSGKPEKRQGAQTELEKARAETEAVRAQAAASREAAEKTAEKLRVSILQSNRDSKFRLRATAAIMMTAALLKMAWEAAHAQVPLPTPLVAQSLPSAATGTSVGFRSQTGNGAGSTDYSVGILALERLRNAFQSFPDEDQKDVVREVNEKLKGNGSACPLAWNDHGVPALYLEHTTTSVTPLMAVALNRCAMAIEDLRSQRNEAQLR